jgi:hypothetical protein
VHEESREHLGIAAERLRELAISLSTGEKPRYLGSIMSKLVTAEYDASQNTLRLVEPLDGVQDHATVQVQVIEPENEKKPEPPWMALRGSLSKEAGEELSQALNELFPPWDE